MILEVGMFNTKMYIRKTASLEGEIIGGTHVGDVMVVTGESDGPNNIKFLNGDVYHNGDPVVHGYVRKFWNLDSDPELEPVLVHLNILDITYSPPVELTLEQLLAKARDKIMALT